MFLSEIKKLYNQYIANTYKKSELDIEKGSGSVCFDYAGREYVDFSSGIGVNSLGLVNPSWVQAVKNQLDMLGHMSNLYYTMPQASLAKALCERTGMRRVFSQTPALKPMRGRLRPHASTERINTARREMKLSRLKIRFTGAQ